MTKRLTRRQFAARTATAAGAMAAGARVEARAESAEWGDLVGRLVYDGTPPERMKLTVDKDVDCCGQYDIRDESLMVGPNGGLGSVYVYVRTRRVAICPELEQSAPPRVLLENRDCIFIPHCMKIWCTRQEFYTTNSQPMADNVAFSPLGDVPANIVLPPASEGNETSATWTFRRSQGMPVPILCNYHPWESAYILPRDDPYVAISDREGNFRIEKLPTGTLEFQAWHERPGYLDTADWPKGRFQVTIRPGINDLGTIKLAPAALER